MANSGLGALPMAGDAYSFHKPLPQNVLPRHRAVDLRLRWRFRFPGRYLFRCTRAQQLRLISERREPLEAGFSAGIARLEDSEISH